MIKGNRQDFKVDKKSIYFKKINEYYSEMTFAFPQVQVGSILEYRYRSTMKNFGGLRDWYFQSSLPVCFSSYEFTPAPNLEFTYQVQKSENYPIVIKSPGRGEPVYFEMKNIPGLSNEPYMDAREDYIQKIRFQITKYAGWSGSQEYMSSWNEVAKQLRLHPGFGTELKVNVPADQQTLVASIANKPGVEKMKIIHNYIRNNYQWDRFKGIYADPGLKTLYNKKIGSASLINFALINLLREAGLEAYPMIVSERGNGKINTKTPFLSQFNNTYAAVIIDGKQYYLNAIDPLTPSYLIPYSILNTTGLIVKRNEGVLVRIKEDSLQYEDNIFINASLSETNALTGKVQLASKHYARAMRLGDYTDNMEEYISNLKKGTINLDIDSLQFTNKDVDTLPLQETFTFKTGAQSTDDYVFLNLSMFTGLESNPFIAKERFSNINFGYKKSIFLTSMIRLPTNYAVEAIPKSIRLINSDQTVRFTREIFYSEKDAQLVARIKIYLTESLYGVDEYPNIKEFFKKMADMLNEQVVLKKK